MGTAVPQRLQKVLAARGFGSRRSCEEMIAAGRVQVNGAVATLGTKVDPSVDAVCIDGRAVQLNEPRVVCLLMYKPKGYVTTRRDPQGRRTVMDLVREDIPGLHPVGRLDCETEGLLLLTNDGSLTFRLTHPRNNVDKTYEATVVGVPQGSALERLRNGVDLEEGRTSPSLVRQVRASGGRATIEITVHHGWKRMVRRMFEAVGHPVISLKRTRLAFLRLGSLKPGEYRFLTDREIGLLRQGVQATRPACGARRERSWPPRGSRH